MEELEHKLKDLHHVYVLEKFKGVEKDVEIMLLKEYSKTAEKNLKARNELCKKLSSALETKIV
jgi:hypothetical protein